jgi:hypothetical protein
MEAAEGKSDNKQQGKKSGDGGGGGGKTGKAKYEEDKSGAIKRAGYAYEKYHKHLRAARNWAGAGTVAFAAAKLPLLTGAAGLVLPPILASPAALTAFAIFAGIRAAKNVGEGYGRRNDANAEIRKARRAQIFADRYERLDKQAEAAR